MGCPSSGCCKAWLAPVRHPARGRLLRDGPAMWAGKVNKTVFVARTANNRCRGNQHVRHWGARGCHRRRPIASGVSACTTTVWSPTTLSEAPAAYSGSGRGRSATNWRGGRSQGIMGQDICSVAAPRRRFLTEGRVQQDSVSCGAAVARAVQATDDRPVGGHAELDGGGEGQSRELGY